MAVFEIRIKVSDIGAARSIEADSIALDNDTHSAIFYDADEKTIAVVALTPGMIVSKQGS